MNTYNLVDDIQENIERNLQELGSVREELEDNLQELLRLIEFMRSHQS